MSTITSEMYVIKRDGSQEPVSFDKVLERCRKAATGLSVNYTRLAQLVLAEIHDGVRTMDLDEIAARLAISYMTTHPDWATLAAQIIISNCQRSAPTSFSAAMDILATTKDTRGHPAPALAADVIAFIRANATTATTATTTTTTATATATIADSIAAQVYSRPDRIAAH